MRKRGSLKRLFKKCAAGAVLSAGLLTGVASAQETPPLAPQVQQAETVGCPAFPEFRMPDGPMHRVARDRTPNPELRTGQVLLREIGINPGSTDGLGGGGTHAAINEYLMFYAPLYAGDASKGTLDATDTLQLKKYADEAQRDARTYGLTQPRAAALRLASLRTGADFAALRKSTHKFDNPTWLYMVKTYGASYGLEFYAQHITLDTANGKTAAGVDSPFIHRQILDLKDHPRLSLLMEGEYIRHNAEIPALDKHPLPAMDLALKAQQKDLAALGFDVGKPDGVRGDLTSISIGEYQLLYGSGTPTGTLTKDEAAKLKSSADKARAEGTAYQAPSLATGSIRMASDRGDADFGYMMELAEAESSFMHHAHATTSSATGLYQFIEGTWSFMVLNDGNKHGLGAFAGEVETYKDDLGRTQARFRNPIIRSEMMDLRQNPQMSALFAADFQSENRGREACYVEGGITRTDLYLAHFLGASDAVWFLTQMKKDPEQSAVATFPEAASYNTSVFYETKHGVAVRERSLKEVYAVFERKFDRSVYDRNVLTSNQKKLSPPG